MLEILRSLKQQSVWLLILPALIILALVDFDLVITLLQWSLFALVLAGVAIVVSMVVFPQIHLSTLMSRVVAGDRSAAIVVQGLLIFFGLLFFSMVYWAKA
jgi:hypothetical protein